MILFGSTLRSGSGRSKGRGDRGGGREEIEYYNQTMSTKRTNDGSNIMASKNCATVEGSVQSIMKDHAGVCACVFVCVGMCALM